MRVAQALGAGSRNGSRNEGLAEGSAVGCDRKRGGEGGSEALAHAGRKWCLLPRWQRL